MSTEEENIKKDGTQALSDALGTSFSLLRILMVILSLAFLGSGIESIEQYEDALITRFGALQEVREGGSSQLALALPFPVDQVIKIEKGRTRTLVLEDFLPQQLRGKQAGITLAAADFLTPGKDGYLLSRDFDIVHCRPLLKYRIGNSAAFHFNNKDVEKQLSSALRSSLTQAASAMNLEELKDSNSFSQKTLILLEDKLKILNCGIQLQSLEIQTELPQQLEKINSKLSQAYQKAATIKSEAELFFRQQQDEAAREIQRIKSNSDIEVSSLENRLHALQQMYERYATLYSKQPHLTRQLLLQERMKEILSKAGNIIYLDPSMQKIRLDIPPRPLKQEKKQ